MQLQFAVNLFCYVEDLECDNNSHYILEIYAGQNYNYCQRRLSALLSCRIYWVCLVARN